MFSSSPRSRLQPQADELPRVDVHLPLARCAPIATCRCGYNEYGRLHRNERSGTLSGLTRVRQFIQDDAHVYVRPDQLADEIEAMLGEVREAYSWVGLTPRFAFATKPDKAIGDPALWERAEALIQDALDRAGVDVRGQAEGRHVLRARRSTSTSTTRSGANGRWRPSRPTSRCCPSGST